MILEIIGATFSCVFAAIYSSYVGSETILANGIPSFYIVVCLIHLIQMVAYVPAMLKQTQKFYDLVGCLSFVVGSAVCLTFCENLNMKQMIAVGLMDVWAFRLAVFLFYRVNRDGQDKRFKDIKIDAFKFLNVWMGQALWITLTAGPIYIMLLNKNKNQEIGLQEIFGLVLFAFGFLVELISDMEKLMFRQKKENKSKFITSGLWAYSRHPNFCGDIILWIGLSLFCLNSLSGYERYASLVSPIFTYILLTKMAGVNMLEEQGDKKWGGQPEYENYKAVTPVLFPGMGKGSNAKSA